ncbi:hypothetical protein ACTFIZ_008146 [Dictyostelium cf. discoideum]
MEPIQTITMNSTDIEHPLFAIPGKQLKIEINESFKNDQDLKVIGIYNEKFVVCFKATNGGEVTLFELGCNDKSNHFKKFSNICKGHPNCQKNTKFLNNDTIFVECLFSDEYYHYSILNLSNEKIYQSNDYIYGRSYPISNELINEWSRIKLPTIADPNKTIEFIKVDCFNFVSEQGEFICIFRPIPGEIFLQIQTSCDFKKLFVASLFNNKIQISVRLINNESKSGDEIIENWTIEREHLVCPMKIQGPYLLIFTKLYIIIHNFEIGKTWFIDFKNQETKTKIEDGSFITNIKNTLIHWNRHTTIENNENHLYLNIWDIEKGQSIKSIKVDEKYSNSKPPISIISTNNHSNLIIIIQNNEINTLKFN